MTQASKYFKVTTAAALAVSAVAVAAPVMTEASAFKDINASQHFYNDVLNLTERGIIKGFEDGTFKPGNDLTRGQAAKIIAGVLQLDTTEVTNPNFKDIPTTHQYYGAIAALKQAGIIDGYEDGTFRQGETIQRNHVAKILTNALNLKATNVAALPFTDARADYKEAIAALYENQITTGKTATTFDGSSNVTRGQFAAFIARAEKADNLAQTISFNVEDFTTANIEVNGVTYTYASDVAPLFTEANKAALKNAKITASVKDGVITKVNALTLNTAGTEENVLSLSADTTVDTLVVNADYVSLTGLTVTNDATITTNVENSFDFESVTINGDVIVDNVVVGAVASTDNQFAKNAKKGPKVNFKNTKAKRIHVKRNDVAIYAVTSVAEVTIATNVTAVNLNGEFNKVLVESTSAVEISGTANVMNFVLATVAQVVLNVTGVIGTLVAEHADAKLTVGLALKINALSLPVGASAQAIITNFAQVAQQILAVVVGNVTGGTSTGGTSTGGSTGSTTGGTTTTQDTAKITALSIHFQDNKTYVSAEVKNVANGTKGIIRIYTPAKVLVAQKEAALNEYDLFTGFEDLPAGDYIAEVTIAGITSGKSFSIQTGEVNFEALKKTIKDIKEHYVKVSEDGNDIPVNTRWTTPTEQQKLEAVIAEAEALIAKAGVTQAEIYQVKNKLDMAMQDYEMNAQFGKLQDSSPTSIFDKIEFTFDSSVTTSDIATIDTVTINGTTADTATVTTGDTFTLSFTDKTTVTTGDTVIIIVTNTDGTKIPFKIRYENNTWIAIRQN